MKRIGVVLATTLIAASAFAARSQRQILSSYAIDVVSLEEVQSITQVFDVEKRVGNSLEVIVPAAKSQDFLRTFPNAKLVEKDIHDVFDRKDSENPRWRDGYHNFTSIQAELNTIVQTYPTLATLEHYGDSEDGQALLALRLTGTAPSDVAKPEVMITSSTHGNEIATPELVMAAIQQLVKGYGNDTRMTQMLDKHIVYFIPVLSPDGYVNESREIHGLDPNRDYPYPSNPNHKSTPTIANEMKWFPTHNIVGSIDIHSPAEMVMYPWAYTGSPMPSADLQRYTPIANQMGEDLGFPVGQIYEIIYPAPGSSADYWYWKNKTLAIGLEIGGGDFAPNSSELPSIIQHHLPALFHFIEYF